MKFIGFPPKILEKTSQSWPHPRDPRKSWKKPHNLGPIPRTPENPGKNLTILRMCLLVGWLLVGADKLCRRPLRGQSSIFNRINFLWFSSMDCSKCMMFTRRLMPLGPDSAGRRSKISTLIEFPLRRDVADAHWQRRQLRIDEARSTYNTPWIKWAIIITNNHNHDHRRSDSIRCFWFPRSHRSWGSGGYYRGFQKKRKVFFVTCHTEGEMSNSVRIFQKYHAKID